LHEDDGPFWIDAGGQPVERHLEDVLLELGCAFKRCQRMKVDDAVDAIIIVLQLDVVLNSADVITDVLSAGRARPGENTFSHNRGKVYHKCVYSYKPASTRAVQDTVNQPTFQYCVWRVRQR